MPALRDYTLVMVDAPAYQGMMQRHQQLTTRLASRMPVVYCQFTPSAAAVYLKRMGSPKDLAAYKQGLTEVAPGLKVLATPPGMPTFFNFQQANMGNQKMAGKHIAKVLSEAGVGKRILWLAHPRAIEMVAEIPHDLVIFDCYDAFGDFENEARIADQVKALEERALKESDLVFASARKLYAKCREVAPHTYLVPNGADVPHFSQEHPKKPTKDYGVDIEALKAKGKVVGYVGDIGSWFDHMLLISTAQLNPKISFVFVGPMNAKIDSLVQLRNTYFTGRVDYADLPWFVQHFDACIIPFVNGPITDNLNPIKLYEYFATGKPVVTTDIPEVRDWEGLIAIGNNGRAFYTKLEMELNLTGNTPQKPWVIAKRKEIAEENSWEARVERIATLMEGALGGTYPEPEEWEMAKPGARAKEWRQAPVGATAAAAPAGDDHQH